MLGCCNVVWKPIDELGSEKKKDKKSVKIIIGSE
jgi:hypothetical protein